MPLLPFLLASLAATVSSASTTGNRSPTGDAPVSRDMCTAPAGWSKPFTHVYRFRNGGTVVFVGVEHTEDLDDATHQAIKAAFARYKPGLVLIEGTSSAKSEYAWFRNALADSAKQRSDAGAVGENLYAVRLASDSGTQFSGWDFSPDQDYRVLLQDKFAIEDALGVRLMRSRIDPFGGERTAGEVARQLRYAATVVPVSGFDYAAWHRRAYGERFDPANGTPCGRGIGGRVASDLSYRRNLNLVGLIERDAQPGRTLLVEAGANHWLGIRDWLSSRSSSSD